MTDSGLSIRDLELSDLPLLSAWSQRPHVERWWHEPADLDATRAAYLPVILGTDPTHMCVVELEGRPIGCIQWARWRDYPQEAGRRAAAEDEVSVDYFIGEPDLIGQGIGTRMIAAALTYVRQQAPDVAGALIDPEQGNRASCRALEKNGFRLVDVRQIQDPGEPVLGPTAIYRLRFSD